MDEVFGSENFVCLIIISENQLGYSSELLADTLLTICYGMQRIEDQLKYRQLYSEKALVRKVQ